MSKPIVVKFDNSLPDQEIKKVLLPTSNEEGGNIDTDQSEVKITGVYTPLVKFNNRVLPWEAVIKMTLRCDGFLPEMSVTFIDYDNISAQLDTPGPDNEVWLEILAPFDSIYKKIKLHFYVRNIYTNSVRKEVTADCIYVCDHLNDAILKSFGKISTYELFEQIARELKLGLCSNLDGTDDKIWIYARGGDNYINILKDSLRSGGSSTCVLDGWIDWWNNINLINLCEAYGGAADQDLKVWVKGAWNEVNPKDHYAPFQIPAEITNDYRVKTSPLYVDGYSLCGSNTKNRWRGTDRAILTWDTWRELPNSVLVQDGSGVKSSVFTNYIYKGEFDGETMDSRYLIQPELSDLYHQKIENGMIRVCLQQPCLGLMRGSRVNVKWYDQSNTTTHIYEANKGIETNIPMEDDSIREDSMIDQTLNMKISGQYYIVSTWIEYNRKGNEAGPVSTMKHWLTLSRNMGSYNYSDATLQNNY